LLLALTEEKIPTPLPRSKHLHPQRKKTQQNQATDEGEKNAQSATQINSSRVSLE